MVAFINITLKLHYTNLQFDGWEHLEGSAVLPLLLPQADSPVKYYYVIENDCIFEQRKKGYVLFNDALNTFYVQWHVRTMVKDHSDSEETCCCHYMGYI